MCYSVLDEITQVKERENCLNIKFPQPYYLFVQKYGRSMEAEMPEIAKTLGNGKWFSFTTEGKKKDVTMTNRFVMELEKNAEIGKPFQGCVLVELTGEEDTKELFELLDYMKHKTQQFGCVFSTRALKNAQSIKERLEQHFFIRQIDGRSYEAAEQAELFLNILSGYGFEVDALNDDVQTIFSRISWEESDMVQSRVENLARNIVYDKMLQPEAALEISADEVEQATEGLKKEAEKIRCIGFVRGE